MSYYLWLSRRSSKPHWKKHKNLPQFWMSFPLDWWFSTSSNGLDALLKIFSLKYLSFLIIGLHFWSYRSKSLHSFRSIDHKLKITGWDSSSVELSSLAHCIFTIHGCQGFENLMNFSDFISGIQASSQVFGAQVRRKHRISLLFHSKRTVFVSKDVHQGNCLPKSTVHYCSHLENVHHLR